MNHRIDENGEAVCKHEVDHKLNGHRLVNIWDWVDCEDCNLERPTINNLHDMIKDFLALRSKTNGGFAPVEDGDVESMATIIGLLIELKYEHDPDGDLPIDFRIVDRTKYGSFHSVPVPYGHDVVDLNARYERAVRMNNNFNHATRDMQEWYDNELNTMRRDVNNARNKVRKDQT